jgi:hypothetical protein
LELPTQRQNLTSQTICPFSSTALRAPNFSQNSKNLNWFTLTPPLQRHRGQLHCCWASLCDGNPVTLAGKIWYVLAKQPHKFLRTHCAFV